ncbi:MAG: FHA domain-containing protein [Planctomycetaceae bacterium]
MVTALVSPQEWTSNVVNNSGHYTIWIDGVGAYLLCLGERVTIGGPSHDKGAVDLSLFANLSRKHATITRGEAGYVLEAHAQVKVSDRVVESAAPLSNNYIIELGGSAKLRFRTPSVLSATAVLNFESDHRPAQSVDGVILFDQNCLLGPGRDNHIRCPEWTESLLLYRKEGKFWCKSQSNLMINGRDAGESSVIEPGEVVSGLDLRFRIEETV